MTIQYDLIIKGGRVIDALNGMDRIADIAVKDAKILTVAENLNPAEAETVVFAKGMAVIPGLIDTHVHIGISSCGFSMLARAGVTTCLDMSGSSSDIRDIALTHGIGITYGTLEAIRPGVNVPTNDPTLEEIRTFVETSLENGSFGVKIMGGHFPLTPGANERLLRFCQDNGVYIAWHAGSTENGSNMAGVREAVKAAAGGFLHLPHINAYCRGVFKSPTAETLEALELLEANPAIISESYLSSRNGSNLVCDENGIPKSKIPQRCLTKFGFTPDVNGMRAAIEQGVLAVMIDIDNETRLITGKAGVDHFNAMNTNVSGSFDHMNPISSRVIAAAARRYPYPEYVVDALATDGGCIPRNVTLQMGMELVRMGGFTWLEFVHKACLMPSRMLGLKQKGHLSVGADADITVFDTDSGKARYVFAGGRPILNDGILIPGLPTAFCTEKGLNFYEKAGIPHFKQTPTFEPLNRTLSNH